MGRSSLWFMLILISIAMLSSVSAEIIVNSLQPSTEPQPPGEHNFQINLYITSGVALRRGSAIVIAPIKTEASTQDCEMANLSFRLSNLGLKEEAYSFSVEQFSGTAYISPNVIIPPGQSRIILFALAPCGGKTGDINPYIRVESDDETASLPLLLHVNASTRLTDADCRFFYSEEICTSPYYVRLYQDRKYVLQLSDWFFDPDGDKLDYSAKSTEMDIRIKGDNAEIAPRKDFSGASEVVFSAEDASGGKAEKRFFFHILKAGKDNTSLPLIAGVIIIISLLLLVLLTLLFRKN